MPKTRVLLIIAALTILAGTGCIHLKRIPGSWPKPIAATEVKQFEGVFSNLSIDSKTGQIGDRSSQLFDFLTGKGHSNGKQGTQVQIISSPDGTVLDIHLLNQEKSEIDSATLKRGNDFDYSEGSLILYGPFSGLRGISGNLGNGVQHQLFRLYLSATHDLIGKQTEKGAGFLFYTVPVTGMTKTWMLWPKITNDRSG
jgi:hypothetical protein